MCDIRIAVSGIRLKLNILAERGETACLENCPRASSVGEGSGCNYTINIEGAILLFAPQA